MPHKFSVPQLETKKYIDANWPGYLLDAISLYLKEKPEYYLPHENISCREFRAMTAVFQKNSLEKIIVSKIEEHDSEYEVYGFPVDRDFNDFQKQAKKIYEGLLEELLLKAQTNSQNFKYPPKPL